MSAVAAEAEEEEVALKVAVRLRPKLRREKKEAVFWEVSPEDRRLRCTADKSYRQAGNQRVFQRQHGPYAAVFGPQSRTEHVHADLVRPIVASFLDGYNGCVFAYGQTGSGKTHTLMGMHMHGPDAAVAAAAAAAAEAQAEEAQAEEAPVEEEADRAHNVTNGAERELGVIQRTVVQVLRKMKRDVARRYFLRVSYLEIYNEKLKDLLLGAGDVQGGGKVRDKSRPGGGLSVFDHPVLGPSVKNLTEVPITGIDQLHELIMMGERRRAVGRTNMNEHSSRSHTMFRLVLESAPLDAGSSSNDSNSDSARTESPGDGSGASADQVTVSQLYLVDLAGSENVKKSGVEGKRMREAAHINTSLAQLTLVITQLAERSEWEVGSFRYKQIRIHYRASKLTHVLSGCLGGNARTVLICAVSPAEKSMTETHSTLQFAERAARIVNHVARVKVSADTALIGKHMHDVEALRAALRGDEDEESAALDQERLTLHRRTQDAEAAQALAQAEALEEKQKVAEHRALLQAVSTLNTAFPESGALNKAIQTRVVSPVHAGEMQASAGLRELAIVCSEDGEGLIDGDNTQPSKSKDQGWTATKVLEDALDESQASIDVLRKQAAERRAVADTIRSNMTENGVPSSVLDTGADILSAGGGRAAAAAAAAGSNSGASEVEQDQAYAELCRATDALALRFGRNTSLSEEDPDAKDADDRDFLELMCEQVIVPLKNGSVSSVDALATLKDMCERQNEIRGTEAYTLACEGAVSSDDLGLDGDVSPSSTPSGKASQQPPRMNISGFKPLPRDRADLSAAVANTNVRVSTLEGSLEAMQAKFDRMERRLKNRDNTIKRIPKREEDAAGGKGRMCSGGDDGGCVMS